MKRECEVLKEREKDRDKEYAVLKAKCEAVMEEFDKNPVVMVLRQKIVSLLAEVKEHKKSMERMLLESQKGYQENLTNLELKVAALEAEKSRLEAVEATLRQEVKSVKSDRAEVVLKVVPYVAMELVHSDKMVMIIGKPMAFDVFHGRCDAFEEVTDMKDSFDLAKVKGYRPSYKKEHSKAGNDLATANFPFLSEVVPDPSASVEALLYKKSKSLRRPTLTKSHALTLSAPSQEALHPLLLCQILFLPQLLVVHYVGVNLALRVGKRLEYFQPFTEVCEDSFCKLLYVLQGFASTHLVECSTAIAKNFKFPKSVGRGPTILIP
ncbi:hypothetical protein Tco_0241544 [Tanacetum coccineum]